MSSLLDHATQPVAQDWPVLVPLDTPDLPRLELENLPSWAGAFAKALAASTETPPELAAGLILATCATAVARRLRVQVRPHYTEPCNLWIVTALPPGNRKSAVHAAATRPLIDWEVEQAALLDNDIKRAHSLRKTLDARAKEIRAKAAKVVDPNDVAQLTREASDIEAQLPEVPVRPQLWTSDVTPERLGTLLAEQDECMAWLSSEGGMFDLLQGRYSSGIPNLDLILKAHSGDPERVDRGHRPPIFLQHPCLSIGLSPQPDVLHGLASKPGFRGRGLLGRFLYLLPASPLGYRTLQTQTMPSDVISDYSAGIRAMLCWPVATDEDGEQRRYVLQLSDGACNEHLAFAHNIERLMQPGQSLEHATDWAGKAPGAAARLAAVLHGIKHAHGEPWHAVITTDTMKTAVNMLTVMIDHSLVALNVMGADQRITHARLVWGWIRRGRLSSFRVRDAFNSLRHHFPHAKQLHNVLTVLEERGYIDISQPPQTCVGRPPSPIVTVRPDLARAWQ